MKRPRVAIIGVGEWGKNLLATFSKYSTVAAVCHLSSSKTKAWLQENYPDTPSEPFRRILGDQKIDAVVICTPISSHYTHAQEALLAGKDVFLEKPGGLTLQAITELTSLAKRMDRILFVGYVFTYHPVWKKLKKICEREKADYFATSWEKWGSFSSELELNLLSHEISLAIQIFPKLTKLQRLRTDRSLDADKAAYSGYIGVKQVSDFNLNRISPRKRKNCVLVTRRKSIFIWENDALFKKSGNALKKITIPSIKPLDAECKEFLKALTTRKVPTTDGNLAIKVHALLKTLQA